MVGCFGSSRTGPAPLAGGLKPPGSASQLTPGLGEKSGGAALAGVAAALGLGEAGQADSPEALFAAERALLEGFRAIPLLDLPRAYASGPRMRDLRLRADGTPDLADASLEDAR